MQGARLRRRPSCFQDAKASAPAVELADGQAGKLRRDKTKTGSTRHAFIYQGGRELRVRTLTALKQVWW